MKLPLTITFYLLVNISFELFAQPIGETIGNTARIVAAGEYATVDHYDNEFSYYDEAFYVNTNKEKYISFIDNNYDFYMNTISRYMFDNDSGMEILVKRKDNECYVLQENGELLPVNEDGGAYGDLIDLVQGENSAILIFTNYDETIYYENSVILPGNTPEYDDLRAKLGGGSGPPVTRIDTIYQIVRDTVYIENVTSRIDTVRELITERIYTSDTVYLSKTINIEGGADTVFISRTTTQRDTIYSYSENTIYNVRVDSTYLLGADYLADLNTVTAIDPEFESQIDLLLPYPSPTSDYVTLTYSSTNKTVMSLAIYDNLGNRIDQFMVRGENSLRVDVRNYSSGVYVCMAYGPKGKTTTRKFVVN